MIPLKSLALLDRARKESHDAPVVLYKHSAVCGMSTLARREVKAFVEQSNVPVYEVVVQSERDVSNEIESIYGIRHESPQAIVLYRDEPAAHASHGRIRTEWLAEATDTAAQNTRPS